MLSRKDALLASPQRGGVRCAPVPSRRLARKASPSVPARPDHQRGPGRRLPPPEHAHQLPRSTGSARRPERKNARPSRTGREQDEESCPHARKSSSGSPGPPRATQRSDIGWNARDIPAKYRPSHGNEQRRSPPQRRPRLKRPRGEAGPYGAPNLARASSRRPRKQNRPAHGNRRSLPRARSFRP